MLPDRLTEQGIYHSDIGDTCFANNPRKIRDRRGATVFRKMTTVSEGSRDLIALVAVSILLFVFSVFSGGLDGIDEWQRRNGISKFHVDEFVVILVTLGIATAIFLARRTVEKGSISGRKQAILQTKVPAHDFFQVETAKKEWERSLDSFKDMVILSDFDGTIYRCNRAFRDFIGRSYVEIQGDNLSSLLSGFGIGMEGLDLKILNVRFHISGKWFVVKSYPYEDTDCGQNTKTVIVMHEVPVTKRSDKVRFVWGRTGAPS